MTPDKKKLVTFFRTHERRTVPRQIKGRSTFSPRWIYTVARHFFRRFRDAIQRPDRSFGGVRIYLRSHFSRNGAINNSEKLYLFREEERLWEKCLTVLNLTSCKKVCPCLYFMILETDTIDLHAEIDWENGNFTVSDQSVLYYLTFCYILFYSVWFTYLVIVSNFTEWLLLIHPLSIYLNLFGMKYRRDENCIKELVIN